MTFNNSSKNSKGQVKIPPNNINININFNVKDNKQLIGKKIDNVVHVSHNSRQQIKKPNFFLDNNKEKKSNLSQFQSEQNQFMKTKKLDLGEKIKIKQRSAKTSRINNQYIPSSFSTNRLKNKIYSKQLRDIFTKGKKIDDNSGPTPIKIVPNRQQKNKSNQKNKRQRAISSQKVKLIKKTPISLSVQNLRRAKQILEKTPSKSSHSRSNSKNSKFHIQPIFLEKTVHSKQNETKRTKIYNQIENIKQESSKKNTMKKSRRKSTQKLQTKINQIYKIHEDQNNDKKKRKNSKQKQNQQKTKQDRLNKQQKERKSNLKPTKFKFEKKKQQSKSNKKIMNDLIKQQKQYERLKQEAMKLLNLNSQKKEQHKNVDQRKSSKKNKKEIFTNNVIEKYFNDTINQKEYQKLVVSAIKIQKIWRGYKTRKQFLKNLESIEQKIAEIRENIDNKNDIFWGNNSNSIIQIQNSISHTESMKTQRIFSEKLQPQDNQIPQPDDEYAQANKQFDTQQAQQMTLSKVMKLIQTLEISSKDSKLTKQLKFLKEAMIKQQQEKNKVLKQNYELRENMKQFIKQQQNNLKIQNKSKEFKKSNQDSDMKKTFDSHKINNFQDNNDQQQQEFIIRMPIKINNKQQNKQSQKPSPKIELQIQQIEDKKQHQSAQKEQRKRQIQNLKKFKLQSDNLLKKSKKNNLFIDITENENKVDPIKKQNNVSNIVTKLTSPKYQQPNLLELLKQKEKILNDKHKKSQQVIKNMYQNKLVSPRSYNFKLNQLEKIIQKQRKSIKRSLKEAEKITNLIKGMQKDKQQIKGLQKLSKEQRWNDAINIIDDFSGIAQSDESKEEQNQKNIHIFHEYQQQKPNNLKKQQEKKKTILSIFEQKPYSSNSSQESDNNKDTNYQIVYYEQKQKKQIKNIQQTQQKKNQSEVKFYEQNQESPQAAIQQQIEQQIEKPGFETNLNFVKQYCIGLCEYIRSKFEYKQEFKQNILSPISYNLIQFLKCYRQTINSQYTNEYNSFKKQLIYPYFKVISPPQFTISQEIFQQFNQTFTKLKSHNPRASKETILLEKYHLKNLLAAFNEALDYEKPSSVYGKPLPWVNKSKHLKNINSKFQTENQIGVQYTNQDKKLDQIFGVAIARVIQWGSSLCGFIPQSLQLQKGQVLQIDEEYVNHIKETRMALMLQKNLAQQEEKMLEFSEEETQVKLQSTQKILQFLIRQFAEELLHRSKQNGEQLERYFQFFD